MMKRIRKSILSANLHPVFGGSDEVGAQHLSSTKLLIIIPAHAAVCSGCSVINAVRITQRVLRIMGE